jgi:hypothetical protein
MNTTTNANAALLDDVIFEFRRSNSKPAPEAVRTTCDRYPRFADEVRQEAILWAEEEMMATLHRAAAQETPAVEAARSRARERVAGHANAVAPSTLVDALRVTKVDEQEAARQMGIPVSALRQVLVGRVMGATIPATFTTMLSSLLRQAEAWVVDRYPTTVATAHDGHNSAGLGSGRLLSFRDAVEESEDGDEVQKHFWLEEA